MIFLDRSYDDGNTWLSTDVVVTKQQGGSSMKIPGVQNGSSFPILKVDNSPRRSNGSLYIAFEDQRNGENDTDIWLVRSTSRGDSWTLPLRINMDPPGKHQFMPVLATDPTTGGVFVLYYDRRDSDGLDTQVYLAHSMDGGNTFNELKLSETFVADENLHGEQPSPSHTQAYLPPRGSEPTTAKPVSGLQYLRRRSWRSEFLSSKFYVLSSEF